MAGIIYNEDGYFRPSPVEPFEAIVEFILAIDADPDSADLQALLLDNFGVNSLRKQ